MAARNFGKTPISHSHDSVKRKRLDLGEEETEDTIKRHRIDTQTMLNNNIRVSNNIEESVENVLRTVSYTHLTLPTTPYV